MNLRLAILLGLVWAGPALPGAWDTGPFDNDDALDWVWELTESSGLAVVQEALNSAVDTTGYLEAPTASRALAAAEVVAAMHGKPRPQLPDEVSAWLETHKLAVTEDLVTTARRVVLNVQDLESSELAQLWSESDDLAEIWAADLSDLLERLE